MSYPNGMLNANAAARLRWLIKGGVFKLQDRIAIDDAEPTNWVQFSDNAAGTGKIPYLVGADTSNITRFPNPNGISANALVLTQVATPSAPTITNAGTVGSTTWTYVIVAVSGSGQTLGTTPASSGGSTTTGNATLSAANFNIITWNSVPRAASYNVYRTVAGTSPTSTGLIGNVVAVFPLSGTTNGSQQSTYTLNDTGLVGDGTTAPTTNTTGAFSASALSGDVAVNALSTPVNVVATPQGTVGSTTITYKVSAVSSVGQTAASSAATTTTANATLSSANSVVITWDPVPGAISYNVFRTAAGGTPSTTGLVANVLSSTGTSYTDIGGAASGAVPSVNTTGTVSAPVINSSSEILAATTPNYIGSETGAANALVVVLSDAFGNAIPLAAGLRIVIKLGHTLQAGANTISFNGTVKNLKSHFNVANNIATVYAATGVLDALYDGTQFVDMSE